MAEEKKEVDLKRFAFENGDDVYKILESLRFIEQELTEETKHLLKHFCLPLYRDRDIFLDARITSIPDDEMNLVFCLDLEITLSVDDQEVHIGSYDILVTYENKDLVTLTIKKIVTILIQSSKLYVATQALIIDKKPN